MITYENYYKTPTKIFLDGDLVFMVGEGFYTTTGYFKNHFTIHRYSKCIEFHKN